MYSEYAVALSTGKITDTMMEYVVCCVQVTENRINVVLFLGAFAKLRKATISFVMSVRPSVCLSVGPHETFQILIGGFS